MVVGSTCDGKMRPALGPSEASCSLSRLNRSKRSPAPCAGEADAAQQNRNTVVRILLRRPNRSPREIRAKNRAEILPCASTADRPPLAHADAVTVAVAADDETRERALARRV